MPHRNPKKKKIVLDKKHGNRHDLSISAVCKKKKF